MPAIDLYVVEAFTSHTRKIQDRATVVCTHDHLLRLNVFLWGKTFVRDVFGFDTELFAVPFHEEVEVGEA